MASSNEHTCNADERRLQETETAAENDWMEKMHALQPCTAIALK